MSHLRTQNSHNHLCFGAGMFLLPWGCFTGSCSILIGRVVTGAGVGEGEPPSVISPLWELRITTVPSSWLSVPCFLWDTIFSPVVSTHYGVSFGSQRSSWRITWSCGILQEEVLSRFYLWQCVQMCGKWEHRRMECRPSRFQRDRACSFWSQEGRTLPVMWWLKAVLFTTSLVLSVILTQGYSQHRKRKQQCWIYISLPS